jgi:hypothetical protein
MASVAGTNPVIWACLFILPRLPEDVYKEQASQN